MARLQHSSRTDCSAAWIAARSIAAAPPTHSTPPPHIPPKHQPYLSCLYLAAIPSRAHKRWAGGMAGIYSNACPALCCAEADPKPPAPPGPPLEHHVHISLLQCAGEQLREQAGVGSGAQVGLGSEQVCGCQGWPVWQDSVQVTVAVTASVTVMYCAMVQSCSLPSASSPEADPGS